MASPAEQARIDDLLDRTGMNDRQIGQVIGVSQPTVWRLRNAKVTDVRHHIQALERHLGIAGELSDADLVADLIGYASRVPALREALLSLHKLMHDNE